jgi:hypothetical protein
VFLSERRLTPGCGAAHDPGKWEPIFGKDHTQNEKSAGGVANRNPAFTMTKRLLRKINFNATKRVRGRANTARGSFCLPFAVALRL